MESINLSRSIRIKLMSTYILLTILLVSFFVGFSSFIISKYYNENIRVILSNQADIINNYYKNYIGTIESQSDVNKIFENYSSLSLRFQITDNDGNILRDTNEFGEGKKFNFFDITGTNLPKNGIYKYTDNITNQEILLSISALTSNAKNSGYIILSTSLERAKKSVVLIVIFISIVGLILIIVASTISKKLSDSITAPILNVTEIAQKIADGDLDAKARIFSKDETGKLAVAINHMSDELKKVDQLKNEFISSITHELRTPLTSINGWGIILKDTPPENVKELRRGLDIITVESERLKNMVEDLLDFSRLNTGKLQLKMRANNLVKLVKDSCISMLPRVRTMGINLSIDCKSNKILICIDEERIKQVLINILDNSLKHTPKGGSIVVKIVEIFDQPTNEMKSDAFDVNLHESVGVKIQVIDNGCGISEEDIPYLKKKFYKGASMHNDKGIGIGLAICDEIIKLHGGTLDIKSKLNGGTTVTIMLPQNKLG